MKLKASTLFWQRGRLTLSRLLMKEYHSRLSERLIPHDFQSRIQRYKTGRIGGASDESTEAHFATMFAGGVARPTFVYLDPRNEFFDAGATLRAATLDGQICIADAPSGAGAASLAILSTLAELRRDGVLPNTPLTIHLIHCDISSLALRLANQNFIALHPQLSETGIHVEYDQMQWDASSQDDIHSLANKIKKSSPELALVVVGAFSEAFKNSWNENYEWLGSAISTDGIPCSVVWIEAAPAKSKKYPVKEWFEKWMRRIHTGSTGLSASSTNTGIATFKALDPLEPGGQPFDAHVAARSLYNRAWRQ